MDQLIGILREFGFPIFVCLWFMWRMEKKTDAFMEQQTKVLLLITLLAQVLDVDLPEQVQLPRPKKKANGNGKGKVVPFELPGPPEPKEDDEPEPEKEKAKS